VSESPQLSIIIPVFNESTILEESVQQLLNNLEARSWSFEIILAQNGSTDSTAQLADHLAETHENIHSLHVDTPNYGRALRRGIEQARGEFIVCDEIDLGDMDFYDRAVVLLHEGADVVVGSKRLSDSHDNRPWLRRQGTWAINLLLRVGLGFRGTDTHGLKALRRTAVRPVVERCEIEHNLFASELVIRCMRDDLDVREIPLKVQEIRPPSVHLFERIPRVLGDLAHLVWTIRLKK